MFLKLILLISFWAQASELNLPTGLSTEGQLALSEALGCGIVPKLLSNPSPLGGYKGVELGLTSEYIPTTSIKSLDSAGKLGSEFEVLRFTVGKGIYNNIDTFFYFSPSFQKSNITSYGADFRYSFYRAEALPVLLTLRGSGGSGNFNNQIIIGNYGLDLIGSLTIEDLTLYGGVGQTTLNVFIPGGPNSIAADQDSHKYQILKTKTLAGFVYSFENYFLAFEVDRFKDNNYGGKLGYRF